MQGASSSSYTGLFSQPSTTYSGLFSPPTLAYPFIQPRTSYTGVVIQPTPTYHSLLCPTLQWSAILAYSGYPSYRRLPRPTRTIQCRTLQVVPNLLSVHCYRGNKECRVLLQKFGVVQAHRTSSNLLEPQHHRASKVWRGLSQEFGVGRMYRTFSSYLVTGETRSAGCLSTSSGWFKHIEPHRTYSNHPKHRGRKVRQGRMWLDVLRGG